MGLHPVRALRALLWKLPWTRLKLLAARALYFPARLAFRKKSGTIVRRGIRYHVDLGEGIELSLALFGAFQPHVIRNRFLRLPKDAGIIDVGANVGILTLQLAQGVPEGRVVAFEPTHYAFARLARNLSLNPELSARIEAVQSFVSSRTAKSADLPAYASWRVDGTAAPDAHPLHGGSRKGTDAIGSWSLDDFAAQRGLTRIDFIKIDTDGHELEVLLGARNLLARCRPVIVFEIGGYVMRERGVHFADYLEVLTPLGYSLFDAKRGSRIDLGNHAARIPARATIDIAAVPDRPPLP